MNDSQHQPRASNACAHKFTHTHMHTREATHMKTCMHNTQKKMEREKRELNNSIPTIVGLQISDLGNGKGIVKS